MNSGEKLGVGVAGVDGMCCCCACACCCELSRDAGDLWDVEILLARGRKARVRGEEREGRRRREARRRMVRRISLAAIDVALEVVVRVFQLLEDGFSCIGSGTYWDNMERMLSLS